MKVSPDPEAYSLSRTPTTVTDVPVDHPSSTRYPKGAFSPLCIISTFAIVIVIASGLAMLRFLYLIAKDTYERAVRRYNNKPSAKFPITEL